ncbi:sigma 54-interacting transcriptional regulator [Bacilliculturomica massiliensis]|uniref:sigma 54-interacting transcriptional regulator n=1 Tax=Bacilliculturomica massiliensis TaxID=1917867 RepID=UPI00102F97F6|nr:sigma 54-interacting transcriptional regulator [Bacilliculturomica massiliensis]
MMEKIVVLSSEWMSAVIRSLHYVPPKGICVKLADVSIENYREVALEMERKGEADVFVAAANTTDVCQYVKSPVVNIEVSGFDLLHAVQRAMAGKSEGEPVAVVTYKQEIKGFKEIKGVLKGMTEEHTYFDIEDLVAKLIRLKEKGITRVVGTSIVLEKAESLGMRGFVLYEVNSFRNALDRAVEILIARDKEKKKAKSWETIFNNTYGGIIVADHNGKITKVNPFAKRILKFSEEQLLHRDIDQIFVGMDVRGCIENDSCIVDHIYTVGGAKFLTNAESFEFDEQKKGAVISFQDVGSVQKSEIAIRKNLHEKGFVARATFDDILCTSEKMRMVKKNAQRYAKKNSTILLLGKSGVGKEIFAQAIHNFSSRANAPFVAINCAALSSQLLQSELFGYAEYSFTGAKRGGKQGLFEMANGGTIFLDEIGEIDKNTQAQLLRVIETGEVMRVGGEKILPVDARIIAATNRDLWAMVESGEFREDLYYRLCVLEVKIPSLSQRREDIPLIAMTFLNLYCADLPGRVKEEIATSRILAENEWKGNIRELRNIIERFAAVCEAGDDYCGVLAMLMGNEASDGLKPEDDEVEKTLRECGGNRTLAAEKLGISRTTLWRRLNAR